VCTTISEEGIDEFCTPHSSEGVEETKDRSQKYDLRST
jgi:hypothetical protein